MDEFVKKLINRLLLESSGCRVFKLINPNIEDITEFNAYKKCIEIVNQLAEEYKGGWIPCSERLPQESEPVDTLCKIVNVMLKNGMVTSGWCNRYLEKWYVLDHHHDYPLPCEYKDVIAWQPLPAPYKECEK